MGDKGTYFAKGAVIPANAIVNLYHPDWHTWRHDSGRCRGCGSSNVEPKEVADGSGEVRGERMECGDCGAYGYSDFC
jgi:hypothetical protein